MIFKVLEGLKVGNRIRCMRWNGSIFIAGKIYTVQEGPYGLGCHSEHTGYFAHTPWEVEPFELVENSLFALLLPDPQP